MLENHARTGLVSSAALAVAAVCMVLNGTAAAQTPGEVRPSIQVTSEATVTTPPDRAEIDIGVTTQAQTSKAAARKNAERLETVLDTLRNAAGNGGSPQTVRFSVFPNYRQREDRAPEIESYTATNIVRVTLGDLTRIGDVIDAATESGANQVQRLQLGLKDEDGARSRALREAAVKARHEAGVLASAMHVDIVRTLSVVEATPSVRAPGEVTFAAARAAETPIELGPIEVRATVTLTVEISESR